MAMRVQDVRHISGQIQMPEKIISKEMLQNENAKIVMRLMWFDVPTPF